MLAELLADLLAELLSASDITIDRSLFQKHFKITGFLEEADKKISCPTKVSWNKLKDRKKATTTKKIVSAVLKATIPGLELWNVLEIKIWYRNTTTDLKNTINRNEQKKIVRTIER